MRDMQEGDRSSLPTNQEVTKNEAGERETTFESFLRMSSEKKNLTVYE